MNWIVYLFGSGLVFFIGIGFVLISIVGFSCLQKHWLRATATLLALFGLILIGLSATPLPYWFYALGGIASLLWLVAERSGFARLQASRRWLRGGVVLLWLAGLAVELPYHFCPHVTVTGNPKLYIIGDSVSAGASDRDKETWPIKLARSRPIEIADFSRMGATAKSALRQAEGLPPEGGLVLLEIGGNDLLGWTTAAEFELDLDQLLGRVCRPGRAVLMFELPLPPFCNEFGRTQRQLAAKYNVVLVPKRIFVAVLTMEGATLDSVHLSKQGHERMAEVIWELIRPSDEEARR